MDKKIILAFALVAVIAMSSSVSSPSSSTINITEASHGNLGDTAVDQYNPNSNHGTDNNLNVGNYQNTNQYGNSSMVIKFNISMIPAGVTISNAGLWLYKTGWLNADYYYNSSYPQALDDLTVWGSSNQTWREGTGTTTQINYNGLTKIKDCASCNWTYVYQNSTVSLRQYTGWVYFNVTDEVNWWYSQGFGNATFLINSSNGTYVGLTQIDTKESSTLAQRPQLNITYSAAGAPAYLNGIIYSPNASYFNYTTLNFLYNLSNNGIVTDYTWYQYNGANVTGNHILANGTFTGAEGSNVFYLWSNDTTAGAGNIRNFTTFTVNVDTQPPNETIDNGIAFTTYNPKSIKIQGTTKSNGVAGLDSCWTDSAYFTSRSFYGGASTGTFNFSNTSSMGNGTYNIKVYCNDTYGNNKNYNTTAMTVGLYWVRVWYDNAWNNRNVINITDTLSKSIDYITANVTVNVTGLTLKTNNCTQELMITDYATSNDVQPFIVIKNGTTAPSAGKQWCMINMLANKTQNNKNATYYAYYNNSAATAPNYGVWITNTSKYTCTNGVLGLNWTVDGIPYDICFSNFRNSDTNIANVIMSWVVNGKQVYQNTSAVVNNDWHGIDFYSSACPIGTGFNITSNNSLQLTVNGTTCGHGWNVTFFRNSPIYYLEVENPALAAKPLIYNIEQTLDIVENQTFSNTSTFMAYGDITQDANNINVNTVWNRTNWTYTNGWGKNGASAVFGFDGVGSGTGAYPWANFSRWLEIYDNATSPYTTNYSYVVVTGADAKSVCPYGKIFLKNSTENGDTALVGFYEGYWGDGDNCLISTDTTVKDWMGVFYKPNDNQAQMPYGKSVYWQYNWTGSTNGGNVRYFNATMSTEETLGGSSSTSTGTAILDVASNTINITGAANCSSLLNDVPAAVAACTSNFAGTCISVNASINVTDRSVGGNLTLDGCELRLNQTSRGSVGIVSWGNMTLNKANVTTNTNSYSTTFIVKTNSNLSVKDSFASNLGWTYTVGNRGLEISTPSVINNFTVRNGYYGIVLLNGANSTNISNIVTNIGGIGFYSEASNITVNGFIISNQTSHGLHLRDSYGIYLVNGVVGNVGSYAYSFERTGRSLFQDISMNCTNLDDFDTTNKNDVFLNVSCPSSSYIDGGDGTAIQWYLDVFANFTNSTSQSGINITIQNSANTLLNYSVTNSTGWGAIRMNMSQYNVNVSGFGDFILFNSNNYTINASLSGFKNASISWAIGEGGKTYSTSDGWTAGDYNQGNVRLSLTLEDTKPKNMTFIYPTPANQTAWANATNFINVSTGSGLVSACLVEVCNATGCVNQTMNITRGAYFGYDVCSYIHTQGTNYNMSFKVFANDSSGYGNYSGLLNLSQNNVFPSVSEITVSPSCAASGGVVTVSWNQSGNNLVNSTCFWVMPDTTMNLTNMSISNGVVSCSHTTSMPGSYTWHVFLNDSSSHSIDYPQSVFVNAAGACSAPVVVVPGGGGGQVIINNSFNGLPYVIGDGNCDTAKGENVGNSPQDCSINLADNSVALVAIFFVVVGVIYGFTENRKRHKKSYKSGGDVSVS